MAPCVLSRSCTNNCNNKRSSNFVSTFLDVVQLDRWATAGQKLKFNKRNQNFHTKWLKGERGGGGWGAAASSSSTWWRDFCGCQFFVCVQSRPHSAWLNNIWPQAKKSREEEWDKGVCEYNKQKSEREKKRMKNGQRCTPAQDPGRRDFYFLFSLEDVTK